MITSRGWGFSDPASIAAGFGEVLHSHRAMQQPSAALDLGEKGAYSSYTHQVLYCFSTLPSPLSFLVKNQRIIAQGMFPTI